MTSPEHADDATSEQVRTRRGLRERTGVRVLGLIHERGSNPTRLARELGWSQTYMARRLDGRASMDLDDLEALSRALDVPVGWLLPQDSARRGGRGVTDAYQRRAEKVSPLAEQPTPRAPATRRDRATGPSGRRPQVVRRRTVGVA